MISKILKFISKYKGQIVFFVILLSLVAVLINSVKNDRAPKFNLSLMNVLGGLSEPIANIKNGITGENDSSEIEKLKKENENLRQELITAQLNRNQLDDLNALKASLGYVEDKTSEPPISAKVIAKNDGIYLKSFTISAGSANGVKKDSIVINGQGLIGRVYNVAQNYSKAVSIIDQDSPVSFQILDSSSDTGMLSQDSSNIKIEKESYIKGYMFNINSLVKVGDTVVTSSLGLYPEGIPIGKIVQIVPDEKNLLKYVVVEPFVNLKKVNDVLIFNKKNLD
ncbi:rod shape-determining protein MreC [Criibacterium bergeronii]|uniref:Cell shape-determining protein MreC n=1 Tax=Criibacterium bergeronii TaxID=1871336 RepID=A0A371ILI9_9FIRM|nr:rod shape-determining protein MreC [Criibacterium bergeronii]MBS6062764.1 rod shape-determining protein MreC [Peptostreptococcaceae bacterium]RDY21344.1 rod shape-determining protein MreC [Criibacterium bergeronii]TRW27760.1 rod shape-determining protein MreC [Criibacterium bergeronii]